MTVRLVAPETVFPLRTQILRPAWRGRLAINPEDATATHVAAFEGEAVIGVATIYPEAPPEAVQGEIPAAAYRDRASVRLRGMATSEAARGSGAGRAVLLRAFDAARAAGHTHLWCNARVGALGFYDRMGLAAVGAEFDIPEIGGHYVMWISL